MPTYDYKCTSCKHTFEHFQPMSAKPLTECPQCGGSLKRIIGTGAGPLHAAVAVGAFDILHNSPQNKKSKEADNKTSSTDKNASKGDKK